MISEENLAEYCRVHERVYGTSISPKKALPQAIALIELAKIVYGYPGCRSDSKNSDSTPETSGL